MEEYKVRMINESVELNHRIGRLDKKIKKFDEDFSIDPIELALMKQQLSHMKNYFMTLMIRCEMTFKANELDILKKGLDDTDKD